MWSLIRANDTANMTKDYQFVIHCVSFRRLGVTTTGGGLITSKDRKMSPENVKPSKASIPRTMNRWFLFANQTPSHNSHCQVSSTSASFYRDPYLWLYFRRHPSVTTNTCLKPIKIHDHWSVGCLGGVSNWVYDYREWMFNDAQFPSFFM